MSAIRRLRNEYGKSKTRRALKDVVILMYHRVNELPDYPYEIVVKPQNFAQHMRIIRKHYNPMRLLELAEALKHDSLPDRCVVVTFDDGYVDNFTQALPILEKYQVPATIFVATGNIDSGREFWWDELERIILKPAKLSQELELSVDGKSYRWSTTTIEERNQARKDLHSLIKPLPFKERERHLDELAAWAGQTREGRPNHRTMRTDELRQLAQSKFIDVGAHTVTHPQLSAHSYEDQKLEIVEGRERLESIIGEPVKLFAYPYGSRADYDDSSARVAKSCGFEAICTTVRGNVNPGSDVLDLPRFPADDWDSKVFEYYLFNFFRS
jgi:peptidoglycan/xylan/chitin deacetylase (PgdA/CDA1 family)